MKKIISILLVLPVFLFTNCSKEVDNYNPEESIEAQLKSKNFSKKKETTNVFDDDRYTDKIPPEFRKVLNKYIFKNLGIGNNSRNDILYNEYERRLIIDDIILDDNYLAPYLVDEFLH